MIDKLTTRLQVLTDTVQKANQQVELLTKNLAQATTHMNQVHGHYNEVAFLLDESKKEVEAQHSLSPVALPLEPIAELEDSAIPEENQGEEENDQINDDGEKQTSEE